jgi:hypothetical protein
MSAGLSTSLSAIRASAKDAKDLAGWADLETEDGRAEVARAVMNLADTVKQLTMVVADLVPAEESDHA